MRLKCGDPFVFGRGGEELLALRAAGVPCTVVPGVSSAIAAPQAAGIPVTHRGVSSGFLCTTGHDVEAFGERIASLVPNAWSLVVLMGYRNRAALAGVLLERGYAPETPVALVSGATFASQDVFHCTVATLPEATVADARAVTLIVGEVVNVAKALAETPPRALAAGAN